MSESLHPTEGIRLLLERLSVDEGMENAVYRATIYTVEEFFVYQAALSMNGSANLQAEGDASLLSDFESMEKMAKSIARTAKRKSAEGLPPWPPRVLRWRGPGRG